MKYTKRDREQAALICAVQSGRWGLRAAGVADDLKAIVCDSIGASDGALRLAIDARLSDGVWRRFDNYAESWAEAEAMLRTGWTP